MRKIEAFRSKKSVSIPEPCNSKNCLKISTIASGTVGRSNFFN